VAELSRRRRESAENQRSASVQYSAAGHPSVEQLVAEQGTGPITDVSVLHGDFWPEEESIEEFLETLHEWRGHARTNPAA
jgi:phage protein U